MTETEQQHVDNQPHPTTLTVAGIGASAGGLAALQGFFEAMSETAPEAGSFAFVVVTHMPPDQESLLPELLQRVTPMPVRQVDGHLAVEPGHVYVIPPGRRILMSDTHLDVEPFDEPRGRRTPVDDFFRSLAAVHSPAVAIILSGSGTDGAVGVKAIKAQGGLLMVQHPDEAAHDGMPRAAIATGLADVILPVSELARKLLAYAQNGLRLPHHARELSDQEQAQIRRLLTLVEGQTGHDFSHYRQEALLRLVRRRMQLLGLPTLDAYLDHLRHAGDEARLLFNDLLLGSATFFEHAGAWQALAKGVIPRLFAGKSGGERVRAWSIGCATGEEAYSLAMLLLEEAGHHPAAGPVQVFASDVDRLALGRAREGLYPEVIEADLSRERLERFFTKEGAYYRVRRELRDAVIFSEHRLLYDPPFSRLDLISSRSVLGMVQEPLERTVLEIYHRALNPGGILFLSSDGTSAVSLDLFRAVDSSHQIYRSRRAAAPAPHAPEVFYDGATPLHGGATPVHGGATPLHRHREALEAVAPPSLLVDDNNEIVHLSKTAGRYLQPRRGPLTRNLEQLVRPELQHELQMALQVAFLGQKTVLTPPVILRLDGEPRSVLVSVRPVKSAGEAETAAAGERLALVLFLEAEVSGWLSQAGASTGAGGDGSAAAAAAASGPATTEARLRRQLRALTEAYETANQELMVANQELVVANEELQTTNEEFRATTQELESSRQELTQKVEEISRAHSDLQNLSAATGVATLFLDRSLHIRRYSRSTEELFNIRPGDRGRPVAHLTHHLVYHTLQEDAERVLRELVPLEREVQARLSGETRWLLARLRPYRTEDEDRIEGVVLTFIDITDLKETESALNRRERELAALNETLEARVRERTEQVRELAAQLTMAEHEERDRVAQILHDDLQQRLYSLQIQLMLLGLDDPGAALPPAELEQMADALRETIRLARRLSVELSPPLLQGEGLAEAIGWLASDMREQYLLEVRLEADGSFPVPEPDRRVLLYQMVRELLFNVVKHTGVPRATVRLQVVEDPEFGRAYRIDVTDDGPGFDPELILGAENTIRGRGLRHAQERLRLIGGRLEIASHPHDGTRVSIIAPPGG